MIASSQPTAHNFAQATAHQAAYSAHNFVRAASSGPIQGPQPTEQPPQEVMPDDKWGQVEYFAKKAMEPIEIETMLSDLFEKRKTNARRLMDAAKRKDDTMAQENAKAWLDSEIKLSKVFGKYERFLQERKGVLQALGVVE